MASSNRKKADSAAKAKSKIDLKGNNAGYATRDRKTGAVTYYKKASDAPGYNDTATGKGVKTSPGKAMYTKDASGNIITASQIGNQTTPTLPPPPVPDASGYNLAAANASVTPLGYSVQGGQFVKDESASDVMNATNQANVNMGNTAQYILDYLKPDKGEKTQAYTDTYGISERQAQRDFQRSQAQVNQYTSELNSITAERDAAMLSLEDAGRGQTSGFIGGEQGRIQRQAAIAALPVQAQLAAAQGNLEIAKSHVDTLFNLKIKDIDAEQAYKSTVANTWMSVASSQQQNLLQAAIADSNARAAEKSQNLNLANQWAQMAIETGQSTLAGKMMKLDPKSPTFGADLAALQGQVVKPMSSTAAKAPTIQTINGVDMQWDPTTGTWVTPTGAGGVGGAPDAVQKSLDQLSFLRNTAKDAIVNASDRGIFRTPVGPSLITQGIGNTFIGNTAFKQLQNQTDTLKTNVLSLMTDPNVKKFFGPQMSNADVRLMSSTGSTLNPAEQEPEDYIKEVQRLDALFNRMQTAVQQGLAGQITRSSNIITAPDGLQIEIID